MSTNKGIKGNLSTITFIPLTKEAEAMEKLLSSTAIHNMAEGPVLPCITKANWNTHRI